jgi:septum formation protein
MLTLILASQSPRRRDLLMNAGFQFHISSLEISEILNENLSLDDALMDLARRKSDAIIDSGKLANFEKFLVLTADTVVVLDNEVIGKPSNLDDAMAKLRRLSGRKHIVKTAIHLVECSPAPLKNDSRVETSEVFFKKLSEEEIQNYVQTAKPLDKAGAYGIQDLPKGFITGINGNLDNVMGLPVKLVEEILIKNGWQVPRSKLQPG